MASAWRNLHRGVLTVGAFSAAATATAAAQPPNQNATEAPRYALVIGHSRYTAVPVLPNVANDLADMCATLTRLRFTVTCLADLPTRPALLAAVEQFAAGVPPGASAAFYYGGHAIQVSGENYLIPVQAQSGTAQGWLPQFVRLSEIFQITERTRAGFQFIMLDACRDNPDAEEPPPSRRATTDRQRLRSLMDAVRGGGRFATYGMAAVRDAPPNTLVLFATGAGASAYDGQGERNGPLTKHLLLQMPKPQQSIDQVVKSVIQAVGDDTERRFRQRQSPSLYGTFNGEFCFNGCPRSLQQMEEERKRLQELQRQRDERQRRESAVVPAL